MDHLRPMALLAGLLVVVCCAKPAPLGPASSNQAAPVSLSIQSLVPVGPPTGSHSRWLEFNSVMVVQNNSPAPITGCLAYPLATKCYSDIPIGGLADLLPFHGSPCFATLELDPYGSEEILRTIACPNKGKEVRAIRVRSAFYTLDAKGDLASPWFEDIESNDFYFAPETEDH